MKDPVKDKLKRFGLFARLGEKNLLRDDRRGGERLPREPTTSSGWTGRIAHRRSSFGSGGKCGEHTPVDQDFHA